MASVSVSDNFNRADANPIGGNWTAVPGSNPVQLVSNQAASTTTGNYSTVYWTPDTFGPDQFSQITAVTQFHLAYAVVRASTTANTYYFFRGGASTPWRLFKMVAGTATQIGSDYAAAVSGQVIKLQVIGNVLTPFINGVAQTPVTDSSIASGQPGFGMYDTNGFIDNWSAGPDAGGGSAPCIVYLQGKFRVDAIIWPATGTPAVITDQLRDFGILIETVADGATIASVATGFTSAEKEEASEWGAGCVISGGDPA